MVETKSSILVVDDEHLLQWGLVTRLRKAGYECEGCETAEEALRSMEAKPAGMVLLDLRLPGMDGMECLRELRSRHPDSSVIMMTGHGAIESAVEAMRIGAYNYLTKPFDFRSVLSMAEVILGSQAESADTAPRSSPKRREPAKPAHSAPAGFRVEDLLGSSATMTQIRALVAKVARSAANTILLTGDSGTGKDLVAQILHYSGRDSSRPFIHVNVAAVPPTLFESELFGHEKGSFTDADVRKQGLLELAAGGSIYLDEIGELGLEVQTKLLQFLEHRVFRRVGGVEMMAVDVRVIAATNVDLRARIAEGRFREDLYYRLRVIPIHLPPLDQRGDDLIELADLFLSHFNEIHGKGFRGFSAPAKKKIRSHRWRGNVRELRNTLERAVTLEEGEWIEPDMLHFELDSPDGHGRLASDVAATDGGSLKALERKMLVSALEETSWNQVRAAEKLGIGRDALRYRMRKYGLL